MINFLVIINIERQWTTSKNITYVPSNILAG